MQVDFRKIIEGCGEEPYRLQDGTIISGPVHATPYQELGMELVTGVLKDHTWQPNDVHIGIAGFYNLDIVAAGAPSFLAIDVNANQKQFWEMIERTVIDNEGRNQFIRALIDAKPDFRLNFKSSLSEEMCGERERENGWLASDENYARVREMFLSKRFAYMHLDIRDKERCARLHHALTSQGLHVGSCYLSNVPQTFTADHDFYNEANARDAVNAVVGNMRTLLDDHSKLIVSGLDGGRGTRRYSTYDPEIVTIAYLQQKLQRMSKPVAALQ